MGGVGSMPWGLLVWGCWHVFHSTGAGSARRQCLAGVLDVVVCVAEDTFALGIPVSQQRLFPGACVVRHVQQVTVYEGGEVRCVCLVVVCRLAIWGFCFRQ